MLRAKKVLKQAGRGGGRSGEERAAGAQQRGHTTRGFSERVRPCSTCGCSAWYVASLLQDCQLQDHCKTVLKQVGTGVGRSGEERQSTQQERRNAPEHAAVGAEKCARARNRSGEERQSMQQWERRNAPEHAVGAEKSARARRSGSTPPEGAPVRRTRASNSHAPSSSNSWRVSGNACGACGSTGATPGAAAAVGTGTGISVVSRSTAARCSFWPGCACCSPLEACMRCPTMFVRRLQQSLSSANGAAT